MELIGAWRRYRPAATVLGVGLGLSIAVFVVVRAGEDATRRAGFEQTASLMAMALSRAIDLSLGDLHVIADFLAVTPGVDEFRFRRFVEPALRRQPAALAYLWAPWVPGSTGSVYEAARAETRPGFDLASNPASREAMKVAQDTGQLAASGRFRTLVSAGKAFGFAAVVPVYRGGDSSATVQARRANLAGFAQAIFDIQRLVETALSGARAQGVNVLLFDGTAEQNDRLLYLFSSRTAGEPEAVVVDEDTIRAGLHWSATMAVGGRRWHVLFYPTPRYLSAHRANRGWGILAGGVLATAAMVAYVLSAARASRIEHLVALRTAELSTANKALTREIVERKQAEDTATLALAATERADQAKSRFLAAMSHEIRTPMNGVIGMTALLLDSDLSPEQRQNAETVRRSGEALVAIINDVLDFSRIETGRLELESAPFALRDLLGETLKTLAPLAREKGLELACDVRPDVPDGLLGDPGRLGQVLVNLAGNAIKFTERGGIAVRVDADAQTDDEVTLHVAVRDTGIGIAPERHAVIFEPFVHAGGSTTGQYEGTGLGLTISRLLVQLLGGRIWVESQVGRGSTFHFTARLRQALRPVEMEP